MAPLEPSASEHPETWTFGYPIHHAESRTQWRTWLELHHATARGVWLCSWRSAVERPRCPYPEAVEEGICFGWIDSTVNTLDEERGLQLFTPRRPKSSWTRLNRRRVEEMERLGLMTDAGRRSVRIAQENGWWTIYDSVEDLVEPDALRVALDAEPAARESWDRFTPSIRKQMLWSVVSAAKEETRAARIAKIVAKAAQGQPAV